MTKTLTAAAFSAALVLGGAGAALAQSSATHGTTGSTMSTTPSTPSSTSSAAMTGTPSGSTMSGVKGPIASEGQLKQDLQASGYSDISDIRREGNYYTANAKQNGHSVRLRVDANSGMVTNQPG